jgi:hypothetical protein
MEAHGAFDGAADRIDKQLRRYTRRLKDRQAGVVSAFAENGAYDNNAGYTLFQEPADEEEPSDAPLIIAETRVDVPDATVSDAVMMLDLRQHQCASVPQHRDRCPQHGLSPRRRDDRLG